MDNTIKVYKEEKELREKRLAAYAETIREKIEMYCGHKTELFLDNLCDQESDNLRLSILMSMLIWKLKKWIQ